MNVMELFVTLAIKDTAYKQGLKDAEGNASSSTSKIGGAFKTVGKVAKTAMAAGSAAAVAFTKTSIDSGMNFDTAMSQVAATMGTTVDKIENVKAKAEEMAHNKVHRNGSGRRHEHSCPSRLVSG